MLTYLHRLLLKKLQSAPRDSPAPEAPRVQTSLEDNLNNLRSLHKGSTDIVFREFVCGYGRRGALIYVDGLVDSAILNENILEPLLLISRSVFSPGEAADFNVIRERILTIGEVEESDELSRLTQGYLSGDVVLLLDGFRKGLIVNCKGWEKRAVTEPVTESVIRGPREGFSESIRTNTSLLRRKIKSPQLIFESMVVGEKTNTIVNIAYLDGVADPEVVDQVRQRIRNIRTDSILESGYIEQLIEDSPFSMFSQVGSSERPDIVAGRMLEGRVAILVDGSPFVLTVPMLFVESFQSPEDYYDRPLITSITRALRYIAFFISILGPSIYVALTAFHHELMPTVFLFTMAAAREGVPFPAVVEAFIMGIVFEILREAGLRLPRAIGQAVSIVGALVMGEAAVSAGLIGAPMVVVVAMTAVAGFVIPSQSDLITILRLVMLVLAGVMGAIGLMMGIMWILIHMSRLKSFGAPYLGPFAPVQPAGLGDSVVRAPLWMMLTRPRSIAKGDISRGNYRVPPGVPPGLEKKDGEGGA